MKSMPCQGLQAMGVVCFGRPRCGGAGVPTCHSRRWRMAGPPSHVRAGVSRMNVVGRGEEVELGSPAERSAQTARHAPGPALKCQRGAELPALFARDMCGYDCRRSRFRTSEVWSDTQGQLHWRQHRVHAPRHAPARPWHQGNVPHAVLVRAVKMDARACAALPPHADPPARTRGQSGAKAQRDCLATGLFTLKLAMLLLNCNIRSCVHRGARGHGDFSCDSCLRVRKLTSKQLKQHLAVRTLRAFVALAVALVQSR